MQVLERVLTGVKRATLAADREPRATSDATGMGAARWCGVSPVSIRPVFGDAVRRHHFENRACRRSGVAVRRVLARRGDSTFLGPSWRRRMPTHRQRLLAAYRGETVDTLPYAPRLDLWYLANRVRGTLPPPHANRSQNELARAEGWAIYFREADDLLDPAFHAAYAHRGIGLHCPKDSIVDFVMPRDVEVTVARDDGLIRVEYRTPVGMVWSTTRYDHETQSLGISTPVHVDHVIKSPADYPAVRHLFANMDVALNPVRFERWAADIGEDGLAVAMGFAGASPMQQIQRDLIDPTQFFFHYSDHYALLRDLVEAMEPLFAKTLRLHAQGPSEIVLWGANFDDMLTYPPYFEREIKPWIDRVGAELGAAGKRLMCHCDGENLGLMDLIHESGMHIAESICPAPMTRVPLAEYYRRWSDKLVLEGGIPSTLLLRDTSDAEFESYLDEMFRAIAPGTRMVVGIADQVPPDAIFSRLQRIGDRVAREGRLPLVAGGLRPTAGLPSAAAAPATKVAVGVADAEDGLDQVWDDIVAGDQSRIRDDVAALLARGVPAEEILNRGMIDAIDDVGDRMETGEAFIPDVLLAARAMAAGMTLLEPHLATAGERRSGRVLIGTVAGDVHDIGKNIVVMMLKGMGFEVRDLGTNVSRDRFCAAVAEWKPDVVALSALLTTTMMEMGKVIAELERRGLRGQVKVIVGGAPLSDVFARNIGADGFGENAVEAVNLVKQFAAAA
ncbi:MAG: corrinoid protein [Alphaproteobacteria bacterium]|nr:corrinoid protein [Alphaproteobacteria bacterium]